MKKTLKTLVAIIGIICTVTSLSSCVIQKKSNIQRSVDVQGYGEVQLENDKAIINLSVITRNWDLVKATTDNALKMTKVQDAILNEGIENENIVTSQYSIIQEKTYQNGKTVLGQYKVTNQIIISVNDISKASNVINTSLRAGANELSSIEFVPSNTEDAYKQARILAIKNAESKALIYASSSGTSLGKVVNISEGHYSSQNGANRIKAKSFADYAVAEESVATPLSSGKTIVSASINASYELY